VSTNFSKTPHYKILCKSVQWFLSCYLRTDRHDRSIGSFLQFSIVNATQLHKLIMAHSVLGFRGNLVPFWNLFRIHSSVRIPMRARTVYRLWWHSIFFPAARRQRPHVKRVPLTTDWSVLMLRMEETEVAADIMNKQLPTADNGWSYTWVFWWRNAVPEALSQKDASRNGVPEPFFSCHRYNEVRCFLLSYRSSF
jgi:hypothetical protein